PISAAKRSATLARASLRSTNGRPYSRACRATAVGSSCSLLLMPTKITPLGPYFLCKSARAGRYRLLIGHWVPRNSTTTALASRPSRARDQVGPSGRGNSQSATRIPRGAGRGGLVPPAAVTAGRSPQARRLEQIARARKPKRVVCMGPPFPKGVVGVQEPDSPVNRIYGRATAGCGVGRFSSGQNACPGLY